MPHLYPAINSLPTLETRGDIFVLGKNNHTMTLQEQDAETNLCLIAEKAQIKIFIR